MEYTGNLSEVFGKNRKKCHKNTKNAEKSPHYIQYLDRFPNKE